MGEEQEQEDEGEQEQEDEEEQEEQEQRHKVAGMVVVTKGLQTAGSYFKENTLPKIWRWFLGDQDMPPSTWMTISCIGTNSSPTHASCMLTACPKGEHFFWIAGVLHYCFIAESEVVIVVVIHRPQQATGGTIRATRQEHSSGHGFLPPPYLHASTRREHHRHIVKSRAKDEDT